MPISNHHSEFQTAHSLRALGDFYYRDAQPTAVANAQWIAFNQDLANQLNIPASEQDTDEGLAIWSGNQTPEWAKPAALAYAGHQFANLVPQLGDGRALLLAEVVDHHGKHWDVQLKGAGRTPFSRGGDGRSAIGPVLREYLLSEAMHALGIPTTRALAAVASGEMVFRDEGVPGAVFTRVASSHLRVGSFQYALLHGGNEKVKTLADYTIKRHFPHIAKSTNAGNPYLAFLQHVAERQAELVNNWLRVGFIHGVMNTDNTSICGETIDYGPAAFMDVYNPAKVFSSIDRRGRYAFNKQPEIAKWNLARLAETLLPLLTADESSDATADQKEAAIALATRVLDEYSEYSEQLWLANMGAKLGIQHATKSDKPLMQAFLALLQHQNVDFTQAFWQLANELNCTQIATTGPQSPASTLFTNPMEYTEWRQRWLERLIENDNNAEQVQASMRKVNPAIIPRNHRVAEAIKAAEEDGDLTRFHELLEAWQEPYKMPMSALQVELYQAPKESEEVTRTFCGT
ncbi:YdiU family protein [Aliidiomarina shirensis]|uniref:Protein nucleotidyltransferase YdiU n=1 Tax=Aliidiomarina shirensis TaxID=1048642 RepID=A0A432WUG1_9GAMM|nr:YdiU family protein [Aliidiomarina shirensis]RUO37405.1 YdiU family protein [Aliidiomarina shirensis]